MARPLRPLLPYEERLHLPDGVQPRPPETPSVYALKTIAEIKNGEKVSTFASWTLDLGEEGLALFNCTPAARWYVRDYDLQPIVATWGLRALDGVVICGAGSPSQTVPVAQWIESPRVAPMMAEAFARLAKQRALAEKWLMAYPRAAAIGLVPNALKPRGKARGYARDALAKLVAAGHFAIVREVLESYGVVEELAEVLATTPEAPVAGIEGDALVRQLEQTLLRTTATNDAYRLVDELTAIDSDRALFAVVEISKRARSRPIRRRAKQSLDAVRMRRGLSEADLAERMLPSLGLADPNTSSVEIAGKTYRLAASTALKPELVDATGGRLSRLPRGATDDIKARWKMLRKELRTVAKAVLDRLELRMITGAHWSAPVFVEHVVGHPILRELARGLLFRVGEVLFRVAEDYTFADVEEDAFTLPVESVSIVHPLDLTPVQLANWTEIFASNEVFQPFDQLSREFARVALSAGQLPGWSGRTVTTFAVLGLKRRGWFQGRIESGPTLVSLDRELAGVRASVVLEPGIPLDDIQGSPDQRIVAAYVRGPSTPRVLSEIARELNILE